MLLPIFVQLCQEEQSDTSNTPLLYSLRGIIYTKITVLTNFFDYFSDNEILKQLDSAIANKEFVPFFQPIVNTQTVRIEMA